MLVLRGQAHNSKSKWAHSLRGITRFQVILQCISQRTLPMQSEIMSSYSIRTTRERRRIVWRETTIDGSVIHKQTKVDLININSRVLVSGLNCLRPQQIIFINKLTLQRMEAFSGSICPLILQSESQVARCAVSSTKTPGHCRVRT